MKYKFGIPENIINEILNIISKYPKVEKCFIYGSRAKGNYLNGSDIDITIIAPEMEFYEYLDILSQLEELNIPYIIDLTKFELLDEPLKEHIIRKGILIYKKTETNEF
ncbi:MAG: hypothetical protein KatS3mg129_2174 [Leptospiraceae bacterium]|nr:MAG: hypothetical protein KatS3mg129_2174 [Leptospiraceae bacterium]